MAPVIPDPGEHLDRTHQEPRIPCTWEKRVQVEGTPGFGKGERMGMVGRER